MKDLRKTLVSSAEYVKLFLYEYQCQKWNLYFTLLIFVALTRQRIGIYNY